MPILRNNAGILTESTATSKQRENTTLSLIIALIIKYIGAYANLVIIKEELFRSRLPYFSRLEITGYLNIRQDKSYNYAIG